MNVLITGAAGGLGRAMAAECARRGYNLFLTDINAPGLERLKQGLERQYGVTALTAACDLTDSDSVDGMLTGIDRQELRFDMLLNVAGADFEGGFLHRPREQVVQIVSLNACATLRITHAILSRRRKNRPFYTVFISSLACMFPMPLKAAYAASKRFVLDFATALRQELRGQNVNVLTVCPGGMATTPQAMDGIAAQGFWGDATTNPLERVSCKTLDYAVQGRAMYLPGALNRLLTAAGRLIPPGLVARVVYLRWSGAQRRRTEIPS